VGGSAGEETTGGSPAVGGSAGQQTTGGSPAIGGSAGEETTGGSPAVGGSAGEETTGGGGGLEPAEEARSQTPYDTTPAVPAADYEAFISNTNDFGLDVFEQLAAEDANVVFSPVSTAFALAMTYAGARGETATQMAAVLHNDLPDTTFHAALNQLSLDLASRNVAPHETIDGTKSVRLSLVNAAWAQQDYAILPDFLDILSANYDAGVRLLDYIGDPDGSRQIINRWVADETEDKIQDLIPPDGITTDTRLVLSNALYFYATWQAPFLLEATSAGTFSTLSGQDVATEMMHDTSYYRYAEGSGYQLLDLPYDGDELCMTIVLPEAGRFSEIRDALSDTWLTGVRAAATTDREIQVSVPKFGFTWGTTSLTPALRALGMTDAFEYPTADFSGIEPTRELYVSDVFHQAFIAVDEHGTEAAAATAVVLTAGAIPDPPVPFTVDRPFIFFIHDSTDVILFAGQVVDPSS
jgi:serpin B